MSEIRIGATEPASGATAFAVSRDSAGILIGVRDPAAPQFSVSRDADGLLLSAWPSIPSNPSSYVASAYVLGLGAVADLIRFKVTYWDAGFNELGTTYTTVTTSLTEWQQVSHTYPVPETAAYVSVKIMSPLGLSQGAYWTALKLEAGTVPTPYGGGGTNLLLNPEFATDLAYWSRYGQQSLEASFPLYAAVYSREASLPSAPLSEVTTGLKYVSNSNQGRVFANATHRTIALPT